MESVWFYDESTAICDEKDMATTLTSKVKQVHTVGMYKGHLILCLWASAWITGRVQSWLRQLLPNESEGGEFGSKMS